MELVLRHQFFLHEKDAHLAPALTDPRDERIVATGHPTLAAFQRDFAEVERGPIPDLW